MNRIHGICFVLMLFIVGSFALSCPQCDLTRCKPLDPTSCSLGVTKDVCWCCSVCYKILGEKCGGPWNIFGLCGGDLTCVKPPPPSGKSDPIYEFNSEGKCMETNHE